MTGLKEMDELDKRIVDLLCRSSQGSYRQLAKELGIHPTTLIQRVKNLEEKGIIKGYRAKIDYTKLGFEYMGIVQVSAGDIAEVIKDLSKIPQVAGIFDVTGESDAVAWIVCTDRDDFSETVKFINTIPGVTKTNTSVVLGIPKDPFEFLPSFTEKEEKR